MVDHPHLDSVDASRLASTSPKVIQKLLRDTWKCEGIFVTGDVAVDALPAAIKAACPRQHLTPSRSGAYLVLIGSDGDDVCHIMYTLNLAHEQRRFGDDMLAASDKHLLAAAAQITTGASGQKPGELPQTTASKIDTARQ